MGPVTGPVRAPYGPRTGHERGPMGRRLGSYEIQKTFVTDFLMGGHHQKGNVLRKAKMKTNLKDTRHL